MHRHGFALVILACALELAVISINASDVARETFSVPGQNAAYLPFVVRNWTHPYTPTQTNTLTAIPTSTLTPTTSRTRTSTPTETPTGTLLPTRTPTITLTLTRSATPTVTGTPRTPTRTNTPTSTRSPTPTPTPTEFIPIEIQILALDRAGHPMEGITVDAINHEYLFRQRKVTDSDGTVTVRGIPGTWSFYGTLGWAKAITQRGIGYAPIVSGRLITQSGQLVTLCPDTTVTIRIDNRLPGFTREQPTWVHLVECQYGQMVGLDLIGIELNSQLTADINEGMVARIGLGVWPLGASPGLFYLGEPVALDGVVNVNVKPEQLGKVRIEAYDRQSRPTGYHLQVQNFQRSWQWAPFIADLPAGPHDYYFSPGDYYILRGIHSWANQQRYFVGLNPLAMTIVAGDSLVVQMGSPSQYRVLITPKPAPGFADYTQLLLDVRDTYNNQVISAWGPAGFMAPHARITTPSGRVAEADLSTGFAGHIKGTFEQTEAPEYEVSWDFGPYGSGTLFGNEYDPGVLAMYAYTTDRLIPQSPAVHRGRHDAWVAYYERIADEMEKLLGVPTDYPLGVIENIAYDGFADEILHGFKIELGMEFQEDPAWRLGWGYHTHEEGHGRIHKPPANFGAIRSYGEAYATVMGYEARARVVDVQRFVDWLYAGHDFFLRHLHGEPVNDMGDEIEVIQFITYYLRRQYGFDIHRRMILEWDNALKPARIMLTQQGYSDLEQFVAVYSYLAGGENLAWLFRIGGLDVQGSRVATAISVLTQSGISPGWIELAAGEPEAVHDQVSVPLMIRRSPATGFYNLQVTLTYDPAKATAIKVYKRDLTYSGSWQLMSDLTKPGEVTLALTGTQAATGLGSVAQVNFKLTPGVAGSIPITITTAKSTSGLVMPTHGRIIIGSQPAITSLPPLPQARLGTAYQVNLTAQGGRPPYTWSIVQFSLPPGLSLESATGTISGIPRIIGEFSFRVEVRDQNETRHRRQLSITVIP